MGMGMGIGGGRESEGVEREVLFVAMAAMTYTPKISQPLHDSKK